MRISRRKLLSLARREAEKRGASGDVISGYVIGSVASGEPMLGNTADVDLVLIHKDEPSVRREMVPLSDEVHMDIYHQPSSLYRQPRELRVHPWFGPSMCEPAFLYDPEHFFEWAQAGVRGQFHRADHVHARALAFLARARERKASLRQSNRWLTNYLLALLEGTNAVACLAGFPAAGRRLTLILENHLSALDHGAVFSRFQHLHGADGAHPWDMPAWLSAWAKCVDQATSYAVDPELHPCRRDYHLRGFQTLVEGGRPDAALWPLLFIWEPAMQTLRLAGVSETHERVFHEALASLELAPDDRVSREQQLEAFLDRIEADLEIWADRSGA